MNSLIFIIVFGIGIAFFVYRAKSLIRGINLGLHFKPQGKPSERIKRMLRFAFAQGKMGVKPIAGFFHILIYIAFFVLNIETIEMILDGIFGYKRMFLTIAPNLYQWMIYVYEYFALATILSVFIFWIRRNLLKINRFKNRDLTKKEKKDANLILYIEFLIMFFFLIINATDYTLEQNNEISHAVGLSFPFSEYLYPLFKHLDISTLLIIEKIAWWSHIILILIFLNYLFISKHLHILLAFPYTYLSNQSLYGKWNVMSSITQEIRSFLNPDYLSEKEPELVGVLGAKDVSDLTKLDILGAYTCTECGRCTDECPANITGKLLSPRKIMMDVRDRSEALCSKKDEEKTLLYDYISEEEIWACTSCMACVEACPIGINPMDIIMKMRQYLVMEQSEVPRPIAAMANNIENNGSPWPYPQTDRMNWIGEKT